MENRLELNNRPTYELPSEVIIEEYRKRPDIKRSKTPDFEPDIVINTKYNIKISNKYEAKDQVWIKASDEKLIKFIKNYNFSKGLKGISIRSLNIWLLKKIILEEFYGK